MADVALIRVGLLLLTLYGLLILGKFHPIHSKTLLAVGGLISISFAYIEAVGIASYLGMKEVQVSGVIPFLLLGIGLDDMFVLIASIPDEVETSPEDKI